MSRQNQDIRNVVVGIPLTLNRDRMDIAAATGTPVIPTGYGTNTPPTTAINMGTPIPPTEDNTTTRPNFKARAAGFIGAMIAVGGVGGMIYGLAVLAMYMNSVFQANRRDDLSVGNPMCFDNNAPALLAAVTCTQKKCSDLSTLNAAQNWVNNHPFDLANIDPTQVFSTCLQYMQQCASSSGFLNTINQGQDSEFLADCDHTLTNIGTGFAWAGFGLLSILSMVVAFHGVKGTYHCMSAMFSSSGAIDSDSDYTPTLDGRSEDQRPDADLMEHTYRQM